MLLEVVPFSGDVGRDLHPVRQAHARDLAERGIRLLRRVCIYTRADAALLGRAAKRRGLRPRFRRDATLSDELVYGGHGTPLRHTRKVGWAGAQPTGRAMVAKPLVPSQTRIQAK